MKKIVGLVIMCIMLLSLGTKALGLTKFGEIVPQWTNLNSISSYLEIDDSGIATCTGTLKQRLSNGTCKLVMNLQKQNANSGWDTIATWTKEGTTKCVYETQKAVAKGTYRLVVTGKVYNNMGKFVESGSANSIKKTY